MERTYGPNASYQTLPDRQVLPQNQNEAIDSAQSYIDFSELQLILSLTRRSVLLTKKSIKNRNLLYFLRSTLPVRSFFRCLQ